MSIKENLADLIRHVQVLMCNIPYELKEEDKIINMCTQQIISEIVGELEKIHCVYIKHGNIAQFQQALLKKDIIETIKKMGEK